MKNINSLIKMTMFASLFSINSSILYGTTTENIIRYSNGDYFEGETKTRGLLGLYWKTPHGFGRYTEKNGHVCEGQFVNGKLTGKGKCFHTVVDNSKKVLDFEEGIFKNWVLKEGKQLRTDGTLLKGTFIYGILNGKGEISYQNGDILKGNFKDEKLHGKGNLTLANGNSCIGNFENGIRTGIVDIILLNGTVIKGDFSDKEFFSIIGDEHVKDILENSVYRGGIKDGMWDGEGKIFLPNNIKFKGKFKEGKRIGRGKITYLYDSTFELDFTDREFYNFFLDIEKIGDTSYKTVKNNVDDFANDDDEL